VNPNAYCPVCGVKVYFYQSPFGGRVYFDNVGWPWPKHPCTDNPRSQSGMVRQASPGRVRAFRVDNGEAVELYTLVSLEEDGPDVILKFSKLHERVVFVGRISLSSLREWDITLKDIRSAPSFVVRTYEDQRLVEFISGRKRRIDLMKLRRTKVPR
jgi:hypothetical protein